MKFYCRIGGTVEEDQKGLWVKRTDAEQAVKDAVAMARDVQFILKEDFELDGMAGWEELSQWKKAQAIIDKYDGGQGC